MENFQHTESQKAQNPRSCVPMDLEFSVQRLRKDGEGQGCQQRMVLKHLYILDPFPQFKALILKL